VGKWRSNSEKAVPATTSSDTRLSELRKKKNGAAEKGGEGGIWNWPTLLGKTEKLKEKLGHF